MGYSPPSKIPVVVTSGLGSGLLTVGGEIIGIGVIPPNNAASYNVDLADSDGFGVCAIAGANGKVTAKVSNQGFGAITFTISGASIDGTYQVKVWYAGG